MMQLILEKDITITLGTRSDRRGLVQPSTRTFGELFVLQGTTPADKDVPKAAGFRWDGERRCWWTDDEGKAKTLAQYARNGLRERWGLEAAAPNAGAQVLGAQGAAVVGTPQQEAFWDEVAQGSGHIVLSARAGCGKTFSIIEAAARIPGARVGFCAFNASIAKELKDKVPANARAFTLHSLGFAAIRRHVLGASQSGAVRVDQEGDKVKAIIDDLSPVDWYVRDKKGRAILCGEFVAAVRKLVSLCKAHLLDGTDANELRELCERHDIECEPSEAEWKKLEAQGTLAARPSNQSEREWEGELARRYQERIWFAVPHALAKCRTDVGLIDYDDMIWLPVVLGLEVEAYDALFVDEAQDMNLCQQRLAFQACPSGRIVIVGDEKQSIYAFRGADTKSMERMRTLLADTPAGCQVFPLTATRRCPQSVVRLAQQIVPDIEHLPDAPEGEVAEVNAWQVSALAQPGDMILCRTNAPLVKLAYELLRAGKRPALKGRDLGKRLRVLIEKLLKRDADDDAEEVRAMNEAQWARERGEAPPSLAQAQVEMREVERLGRKTAAYRAREIARLTNLNKAPRVIEQVEDDCDTIDTLLEGCASLAALEAKLKQIFDETPAHNAITLSSVHGAKGLEADTVYILLPHLMPHYRATRPEDVEQEMNIKYVALTRSKHRLVFAHDAAEAKAAEEKAQALRDKAAGKSSTAKPPACAPTPEAQAEPEPAQKPGVLDALHDFVESLEDVAECYSERAARQCREQEAEMAARNREMVSLLKAGEAPSSTEMEARRTWGDDLSQAILGSDPFCDWRDHVRMLLRLASEITPFDQHDLVQAIERALMETPR